MIEERWMVGVGNVRARLPSQVSDFRAPGTWLSFSCPWV